MLKLRQAPRASSGIVPAHALGIDRNGSYRMARPADYQDRHAGPDPSDPAAFAELDLMIRQGWGDTPQQKLPPDWRTRRNPRGGKAELVK